MSSKYITLLHSKINQARLNPRNAFIGVGINPDSIIENHPEYEAVINEGISAVQLNDTLSQTAIDHIDDMLVNNYFDTVSADGKTIDARLEEAGYDAVLAGETLSMISFANYMEPEKAIDILVANLLKEEFDKGSDLLPTILNPEFEEIGIGFRSVIWENGAETFNAYMVVCDLATPPEPVIPLPPLFADYEDFLGSANDAYGELSDAELIFIELINQARQAPLKMARQMGLDPLNMFLENYDQAELLTNGLPPLVANTHLIESARLHALDMYENRYLSGTSLDGRTADDRIRAAGYQPTVDKESIRAMFTRDPLGRVKTAGRLFKQMFTYELEEHHFSRILNPELTEIGLHDLRTLPIDASDDLTEQPRSFEEGYEQFYTNLVVIDYGYDAANPRAFLKGTVYTDDNGNGIYDLEEGEGDLRITISDNDSNEIKLLTDVSGGFTVPLAEGQYTVSLSEEDGRTVSQNLTMDNINHCVYFSLSPVDDE